MVQFTYLGVAALFVPCCCLAQRVYVYSLNRMTTTHHLVRVLDPACISLVTCRFGITDVFTNTVIVTINP